MPAISKPQPLDKSNVTYTHPEYNAMLPDWTLIQDCIAGQRVVKSKRETYLRHPGSSDPSNSTTHKQRYDDYLHRALFYGVTGRTLRGLVGEVFSRDPVFTVPKGIEDLFQNIDGEGRDIEQLGKELLAETLGRGRCGLLADYPTMAEGVATTVQQLQSGEVRPRLVAYQPTQVINWRMKTFGAVARLALVVLLEKSTQYDDGFEEKQLRQWRVLRLDDAGNYTVQIFRENQEQTQVVEVSEPVVVTDSSGSPMKEIPFTFIGPQDNGPDPNLPPMVDLANLNIAHYNDTARFHDSVDIIGDPTLVIAGVDKEWVDKTWKANKVKFGCRAVIPLPRGATAEILQATPNTLVKESMESKERQMVALGAKLVEQREVQRTATEAGMDESAKTSVLGSSANNVSQAITACLKWCQGFLSGGSTDKIEYQLNTDFDIAKLDPTAQQALVAAYNADIISWEEVRWNYTRSGIAYLTDKEALKQIESDPLKELVEAVPLVPGSKTATKPAKAPAPTA